MNIVRRVVTAALIAVSAFGLCRLCRCATLRHADQDRQHAGADRPARRDRPRAQARRRDLRRAAEHARRPARPAGRMDRQGRPVEARPRAHALRAAHHRRQGRPADGAVRDRRDPVGDGRRAALQQGAHPSHVRHSEPRQVRQAISRRGRSAPIPANTLPNTVFDALAASPKPPKTIAIVTSKFPSVHFMSLGAREVAKKRGLKEVLFLEWDSAIATTGRSPRASRTPSPTSSGSARIGLEGNQLLEAMKKIDYTPQYHFYMYPAPGPMVQSPEGKNALAGDDLRGARAVHQQSRRRRVRQGVSTSARPRPALPYTSVETQAAASYTAWQMLEAAVTATNSLDDKVLADG